MPTSANALSASRAERRRRPIRSRLLDHPQGARRRV